MIIGLRGGHSSNCVGAVGIVKEYEQMQELYKAVSQVLTSYGHTVIDCNSNEQMQMRNYQKERQRQIMRRLIYLSAYT
ncbi:hypothetical protein CLPUN_04470 [Clostridium puniceum]|uniref:Uncharacterized protein n=1 Tax=Clostridium puniceum TaxID=29367 RepID=A0A1S8TWQ9_9CLOT|nr:hypothetical protein [Clostridium puniceum]OOM82187.1 hypothetical protein CLPUN_04470 [Clostridium puniceum]